MRLKCLKQPWYRNTPNAHINVTLSFLCFIFTRRSYDFTCKIVHKTANSNLDITFKEEDDSDMNIDCFDEAQIMFGTYLHLLEDKPEKAKSIKDKVLLIDEVPIISKEIQFNVEGVNEHFYDIMKKTDNFNANAEAIRLDINKKFKESRQ